MNMIDKMNKENNYTLVMWPESQAYMEEAWFEDEAVLENDGKFGSAAYFIPTKYIEPVFDKTDMYDIVHSFENWDGAGKTSDEDIQIWVDKYID